MFDTRLKVESQAFSSHSINVVGCVRVCYNSAIICYDKITLLVMEHNKK